ncbi:hypothetical protein EDC90_10554 [Martelella mediterranea]|uniref:Uncharacterized protein n=1 Tax=Martelella mediterranea TaxID=293089 RepID=A0A4R3ND76_9HYPH|nr:hypothetical protein EDC90_10554 [Martelella mediterranea]
MGGGLKQRPAKEPHERKPVRNPKLGLVIGKVIKRLQHQDLEHHDRWFQADRRPPSKPDIFFDRIARQRSRLLHQTQ